MRKSKAQSLSENVADFSTTATPVEQLRAPVHFTVTALNDGVSTLDCCQWYFSHLANLFNSIRQLDGAKFSQVSMLAELGSFLADDWANFADNAAEEMRGKATEVGGMFHVGGGNHA